VFEKAAYLNEKENILFDLKAELAKYAEKLKQPIISADEYVNMENDETTGNDITDEEIIKIVKSSYTEEIEEIEEKEEIIEDNKISVKEAEIHYSELVRYFESHSDYYNENDLEHFLAIKNKMDLIRDSTTVQVKLDKFLIKKD
jgi:deoxycytidylate deaminase